MKKNTSNIEQLFQELVSQDPSFASQKKEILWLLERMTQHTPSVSIDPLFQNRLKDNLQYHLISQNTQAPQMNAWQKFLLYGIPSLAIGLALIYVLPTLPGQPSVDTVTTTTITHPENQSLVTVPSDSSTTDSTNSATTTAKTSSQSSYQQKNTLSSSHKDTPKLSQPTPKNSSLDTQTIETAPMMMKTSNPIVWGDQLTTDSLSTSRSVRLLQPTEKVRELRVDENNSFSYTINQSWEDLVLQWVLEYCTNHYTIHETLVWVSSDSAIIVEAKNPTTQDKKRITLQFTDNQLTDIQGLENCK